MIPEDAISPPVAAFLRVAWRRGVCGILAVLLALAWAACGRAAEPETVAAAAATQTVSALAAVNAGAAQRPVAAPDDLYRAIEAGVRWYPKTLGCFDITVGPLIGLWKSCAKENRLPTEEEFTRVKQLLGADRIVLDPAAHTVRYPVEGMRVDLGGLGKGFVADEVLRVLTRRGVRAALISMSGDIYAFGRKPGGQPWRVGVRDPRHPDAPGAFVTVLNLADRAVSTSGNYERYVEIQGKRYSHIVDPRTGRTADGVPSVTVIGPNTLATDVLDTSLSVLGVQEGLKVVAQLPGVEAMFVTVDGKGDAHLTRSPGFAACEVPGAAIPDASVK